MTRKELGTVAPATCGGVGFYDGVGGPGVPCVFSGTDFLSRCFLSEGREGWASIGCHASQ